MKKILIHVCCAPCGGQVIKEIENIVGTGLDLFVLFFNPNIYPQEEYELRKAEVKRYCDKLKIEFIEGQYNHQAWLDNVKGYETEKEGGKRCELCFTYRLQELAQIASEKDCDAIATTLTISPHKPAELINEIGKEMAEMYGLEFISEIWRKNEGYKKSCEISKKEDFHRQTYCGCEFSMGT